MKKKILLIALLALLFLWIGNLWAEEPYQGLKFGMGAAASMSNMVPYYSKIALGGILHLTPSFALRPAFVMGIATDSYILGSDPQKKSSEDFLIGGRSDFLLFLPLAQNLSFYTGPGVGYTNISSSAYTTSGPEYKWMQYNRTNFDTNLILGAQYLFNPSIALFIEVGAVLELAWNNDIRFDASGTVTNETHTRTIDVGLYNPALGITFYFN